MRCSYEVLCDGLSTVVSRASSNPGKDSHLSVILGFIPGHPVAEACQLMSSKQAKIFLKLGKNTDARLREPMRAAI